MIWDRVLLFEAPPFLDDDRRLCFLLSSPVDLEDVFCDSLGIAVDGPVSNHRGSTEFTILPALELENSLCGEGIHEDDSL